MLNSTLPPWPNFSSEDALAVAGVIASNRVNYWTGDECRKFESELVAIDGVYAVTDDMDPELKGHPVQLWLEGDAIMTERMT